MLSAVWPWVSRKIAEHRAASALKNDPIMRVAVASSRVLLADWNAKSFWTNETIDLFSQNILQLVCRIIDAPDRVAACREQLTIVVNEVAKWTVLILPPDPQDDEIGLVGTQGVTGGLKARLLDLIKVDEELKRYYYGAVQEAPTQEHVEGTVLMMYRRAFWFARVIDACRQSLKDKNFVDGRDWYLPYLHALCVWHEAEYRKKLGMPAATDEFGVTPLTYLSFQNDFVLKGAKYPDLAWREHYREQIAGGSLKPPFPKEALV